MDELFETLEKEHQKLAKANEKLVKAREKILTRVLKRFEDPDFFGMYAAFPSGENPNFRDRYCTGYKIIDGAQVLLVPYNGSCAQLSRNAFGITKEDDVKVFFVTKSDTPEEIEELGIEPYESSVGGNEYPLALSDICKTLNIRTGHSLFNLFMAGLEDITSVAITHSEVSREELEKLYGKMK